MSAPAYSHVPPSEFQTIQTSYPPMPQQDEKKAFNTAVEDNGYTYEDLQRARAPPSGFRKITHHLHSVAHKFWLFELGASLVSLIIFAIIMLILWSYNHRIYGDASHTSDPNQRPQIFPILAILGALMRAAMLLPVATAIAQLKWGWFQSNRRLVDLEHFDGAAQGMLGSLRLLWHLRFRNIAVVGAALTILALPLDAVTQSAVKIRSDIQVNDEPILYEGQEITNVTYMPRSTLYDQYDVVDTTFVKTAGSMPVWPRSWMINSIKFGTQFSNGLNTIIDPITKIPCPTGYCQFKKAQTLAVSYSCVDRTSEIVTVPETAGAKRQATYQTLPGTQNRLYYKGAYFSNISYERQFINALSYSSWPNESYSDGLFGVGLGPLIVRTAMLINLHPIDDTSSLSAAQLADKTIAVECALYWTIRTMTEYSDETSNLTLSSTNSPVPFHFDQDADLPGVQWVLEPKECIVEGETVSKNDNVTFYNENCMYHIGKNGSSALTNFFFDYDQQTGMGSGFIGNSYVVDSESQIYTRLNDFVTNLGGLIQSTRSGTLRAIESMMSDITFGMSTSVRRLNSFMPGQTDIKFLKTSGTMYRPIFFYEIDWPRLGVPAFVVAFATLFVVYTAIMTRKQYRWKRSTLPLLFHGLGDRERVAMGDVTSLVTMNDIAENLRVRLEGNAGINGARFIASPQQPH